MKAGHTRISLSMILRISRQVLECGDGVREVTALAPAAPEGPKLGPDTGTPTESGDSGDSQKPVKNIFILRLITTQVA